MQGDFPLRFEGKAQTTFLGGVLCLSALIKAKEVEGNVCRNNFCSNSASSKGASLLATKTSVISHKKVVDLVYSVICNTMLNYYENYSPLVRDKDCRRKAAALQPL